MKWLRMIRFGLCAGMLLVLSACVPASTEYGMCTDLGLCPDTCDSDPDTAECNPDAATETTVHHEPGAHHEAGSPPVEDSTNP